MKLLTTKFQDDNTNGKRWDAYEQFHINWARFVQFDDGSLIYTEHSPDPDVRRYYEEFNVTVSCTTDKDCPTLYLSKEAEEPLKTAWLSQGGTQYLVVDHDTKTAMRLGRGAWYRNHNRQDTTFNSGFVPPNKRGGSIYWAGEGCQAVPRNKFKVSTPARSLTNQLNPKLDDVRAAMTAIYRMFSTDQQRQTRWSQDKFEPLLKWVEMTPEQIVADIVNSGASNVNQLIANIATKGFTTPRSEQEVDLLYIK
jgi:hypothetical protein